ncbi:hypothetical protein [Pseudothioclava nitratireducens]|uniref:hypothetical protein n=1 Tax=Pseudothioclava nitratireducens TaxID=1928646 RepID=UPI0023DAAA52|nr:hypothetical protein [Defluviimonas nitratireducens]MDF1621643.1 hypothetical protein [Defluviimonas nitratireducens]
MEWGDQEERIDELEASRPPAHKTYQDTIDIILENSVHMPREASPEAQKAELNSDQFRLRRAFLILAREHCKQNGLPPGSEEALDIFEEANDRADNITYAYAGLPFRTEEKLALTPEQVKTKLTLVVPSYVPNLISHVREHGKLGALQEDLSAGVGDYVKGRFKSPDIDKLLLQALTQAEIVAYIDEMIWKNVLTGISKLEDAAPPSVLRAVWNVCKLIFLVWMLSIGVAASPFLITALPEDIMVLVGLGLGGLGTVALLILGVFGVKSVIQERPRRRKIYQSILDMIAQMNGFYMEFRGAGPFSLSRFKKRVNELADTGVVWPSGLFVLIEDMEERGIRTF